MNKIRTNVDPNLSPPSHAENVPSPKERIWLRLDKDVVEHFRAGGPRWQSRVNDILAEHIKKER